jgi:hypothetical protein
MIHVRRGITATDKPSIQKNYRDLICVECTTECTRTNEDVDLCIYWDMVVNLKQLKSNRELINAIKERDNKKPMRGKLSTSRRCETL